MKNIKNIIVTYFKRNNLLSFKGQMNRIDYSIFLAMFYLISFLFLNITLTLIITYLGPDTVDELPLLLFYTVITLLTTLLVLFALAKRLRDAKYSLLLAILPLVSYLSIVIQQIFTETYLFVIASKAFNESLTIKDSFFTLIDLGGRLHFVSIILLISMCFLPINRKG
jgi:uncharacterized membrane protein YhaH (DUF805 family)